MPISGKARRQARLVAVALMVVLGVGPARTVAQGGPISKPSSPSGLLLIVSMDEARIDMIDEATLRTVASLNTGKSPHEVRVAPDGRTAYVVSGPTITAIDLSSRTIKRTFDLGEFAAHDLGTRSSEHRVRIRRVTRNALQHIPVLDDLALVIQPEDIDPGPVAVVRPVLVSVADDQMAVRQDLPELDPLPGIFARHALMPSCRVSMRGCDHRGRACQRAYNIGSQQRGATQIRRRYGFVGCVPRTINLDKRWNNTTADTQLALAA